jgi:soluble lytic murein transglycosylase-like protein
MFNSLRNSALVCTAGLVAVLALGATTVDGKLTITLSSGDGARPEAGVAAWSGSNDLEGRAWRFESSDPVHSRSVSAFAARYGIELQLSRQIYEAARAERVSPALAFGLVRVESEFDPAAAGSGGGIGLTQIRPVTARELVPHVRTADLYSPGLNLRLGFRYLHAQLDRFDQDVTLALSAYNRGPTHVEGQLARGQAPGTAFARKVLRNVEPGSAATL